MGVLRSGARGNMPATAKRLASWRVLKEMLQSFLRRCSLLDVLESLTVGTCVQHFFQVLSRGGGSLAQVFACPGHNFFFPCPILRFACPVFVDKCTLRKMHPAFSEMHPEKSKMHPSLFFGAFFYQNMSTKPTERQGYVPTQIIEKREILTVRVSLSHFYPTLIRQLPSHFCFKTLLWVLAQAPSLSP